MIKHIGIINGSIREKSYSAAIAKAIRPFFPENVVVTEIQINDLPLFNPDFDKDGQERPESYARFRQEVKKQDAIIFITPEYNRTIPAALKNAIEVGSRPTTDIAFNGKPVLIMTQSSGHISGFGANHHLRQALVFLNAIAMPQPEVYLAEIHNIVTKDGEFLKTDTAAFLKSVIHNFLGFATRLVG